MNILMAILTFLLMLIVVLAAYALCRKFIFNKIREYALATYNYGDLKTIVKENNLDVFFRYKRYFT